MVTAQPGHRNNELAQIHIAKAQLGMADEAYRGILWTIGRVTSSKDLDFAGRQRVIEHMRKCGWKPAPPKRPRAPDPAWDWVNKAAADRQPMLRKIAVILKKAEREKAYADGIAKHMFGVDLVEFCAPQQLHRIVAALEFDKRRRERTDGDNGSSHG